MNRKPGTGNTNLRDFRNNNRVGQLVNHVDCVIVTPDFYICGTFIHIKSFKIQPAQVRRHN